MLFFYHFYRKMLHELELDLQQEKCQNYWIPQINLFENLTKNELVSKRALVASIVRNPKKYVADEWLEYSRCVRKQCCYCGNIMYMYVMQAAEAVTGGGGCEGCICCRVKCDYDDNSCCSSHRYQYDPISLDVLSLIHI